MEKPSIPSTTTSLQIFTDPTTKTKASQSYSGQTEKNTKENNKTANVTVKESIFSMTGCFTKVAT